MITASAHPTASLQVNADGVFRYASSKWFSAALQRLAATGIRGVAVDVWVSLAASSVSPLEAAESLLWPTACNAQVA